MNTETTYEGWANYETWNVALWLTNDDPLYRELVRYAHGHIGERPYVDFIWHTTREGNATPDGVLWLDSALDLDALDNLIREYKDELR